MGSIGDALFVKFLIVAGSIPVITIGASTTALYYVTLKMAKNQESYLWRTYWQAFRDNLRTSTGIWCIMLGTGMILGGGCALLLGNWGRLAAAMIWGLAVLIVIYLFVLTMVFPLAARLDAGTGRLLCMAFMTAVKNFSWVLLMSVGTLCMAAAAIFVFWPLLFLAAGAVAYLHSLILVYIIFPKYGWNN